MTLLRHSAALRLALVVLAMVVWLVATNHCAAGLMRGKCMHCQSGPVQDSPPGMAPECCKALHGLPFAEPVVAPPPSSALLPPAIALAGPLSSLVPEPPAPSLFDHEPPLSFAESVLQQSLLSHAPPSGV